VLCKYTYCKKLHRFLSCSQWHIGHIALIATERCYSADALEGCAVVATADRYVLAYSLQGGPREVYRQQTAKLKYATRCIAVLPQKVCLEYCYI
jgi:hypothetical protein